MKRRTFIDEYGDIICEGSRFDHIFRGSKNNLGYGKLWKNE